MITERTLAVEPILTPPHDISSHDHIALENQGGMEPELQDHIGAQLRAVYNEALNEPVPQRFLDLLAALERKQAKHT